MKHARSKAAIGIATTLGLLAIAATQLVHRETFEPIKEEIKIGICDGGVAIPPPEFAQDNALTPDGNIVYTGEGSYQFYGNIPERGSLPNNPFLFYEETVETHPPIYPMDVRTYDNLKEDVWVPLQLAAPGSETIHIHTRWPFRAIQPRTIPLSYGPEIGVCKETTNQPPFKPGTNWYMKR